MAPSTQARILQESRRLLDAEGASAVTMRRVAAGCGITAMAVYRHYADRDALLNAVAEEGFQQLAERLQKVQLRGSLEGKLKKTLDTNLDFALSQPRLFELMFLSPRKHARQFPPDFSAGKSPTANRFAQLVTEGIATQVFRQVDVWEVVFESGALLQGLLMLFLGGRVAGTEREFRLICHRAMGRYLDGIRNK